LAKRADANAKDDAGMAPLHVAASLGSVDMVELLLANGADVNATGGIDRYRNDRGITPLHEAVLGTNFEGEYLDVVKSLLAKGADINARDSNGVTACFYANQQAMLSAPSPYGSFHDPSANAIYQRHMDIVHFLLRHGGRQ
jgi:ankyrin repeat protein